MLHDFSFLQDDPPALQTILIGDIIISSTKESYRQGQRERALAMLHQMIEDAHKGKRQFLSGTLLSLNYFLWDGVVLCCLYCPCRGKDMFLCL